MKKLAALMLAFAVLCGAFSGCVLWPVEPEPTAAPTALVTDAPTEAPPTEPVLTPAPTEAALCDYAYERVDHAEQLMDIIIPFIEEHPVTTYSSSRPFTPADRRAGLTRAEAALYDAMRDCADSFVAADFTGGEEEVKNALAALFVDRPDIETYFTVERSGGKWRSVFFEPEAYMPLQTGDMELLQNQLQAFRAVSAYVASRVPEEFSAIDKYRALAYYIILNNEYIHVHGTTPNYATCAYGALVNGYSICQGYALGFEYLCRCADLDCRRVRNEFNDDNMHFWDIVTLDQGTYYVDVTWSDSAIAMQHPSAVLEEYGGSRFFTWFIFPADQHHVSDDGTTTTGRSLDKRDWLYEMP